MPTARAGWTYDTLTELADGPAMIKELADQVDAEIGLVAYTSATRPTTGNFDGRIIYETDTTRVMRYNGSAWQAVAQRDSQTYTPSWTNGGGGAGLSIGSGTLSGRYWHVGDLVTYRVRVVRAADSNTGTTDWIFSLPVSPDYSGQGFGSGAVNRSGSFVPFQVVGIGGTSVALVIPSGGTAGAFGTRVSSSVPGSWASGDEIVFGGTYKAAASV